MCAKTIFVIILFLCSLSMHACNSRLLADILHKKLHHPHKIEETKLDSSTKISVSSNGDESDQEDVCKKNKDGLINIEGTKSGSSEDCKSSLRKALLHATKSAEGSRWTHQSIREKDLNSSIFKEEYLSETDYQPPHRKSPIHNK
ncbi:hypothetical protein ABFS82_06G117000 [Erythranthe guttata]|uniref:Uncharacterized protein n=1 Tax=Erythranthe guttata TaxID=4155 RepID=A0A022QRG6_ERYGU|nr:PREDICTED: uncharacterized protein LOC105964783 [Erythranthe guttata]EYU31322.1 hypothetical protein MIMGU_mgv1a015818mg [Erythranthe guttata]|eukprot:XP_012844741.1 PREDICTED: uncharacterized protein LOC105964783 [Erythranthe guttata]